MSLCLYDGTGTALDLRVPSGCEHVEVLNHMLYVHVPEMNKKPIPLPPLTLRTRRTCKHQLAAKGSDGCAILDYNIFAAWCLCLDISHVALFLPLCRRSDF